MPNPRAGRDELVFIVFVLAALVLGYISFRFNYEVNKARFPSAPEWSHYGK